MAEETKNTQVKEETQTTETTETETFIEEVEVKRTRKGPSQSSSSSNAAAAKKGEPYKVIVPLLNIREKASLVAEIIGTLQEGDIIEITTKTPKGFGKIADDEGYVKLDYVEKVEEAVIVKND